jgi:arylformamidase
MIYDITRPISPSTAVWPGDAPAKLGWTARKSQTGSVNIGSISMSTHTGTHVDAPLHYDDAGHSVDRYDISVFVGRAHVWSAPEVDVLLPQHLPFLEGVERLLIKTAASGRPHDVWSDDFMSFAPETISALGRMGIVLIGTDGPSYDPAESKNLPAHHALANAGIANLENLWLSEVKDGVYMLVALPLRLSGMDASPIRAILFDADTDININVTARP